MEGAGARGASVEVEARVDEVAVDPDLGLVTTSVFASCGTTVSSGHRKPGPRRQVVGSEEVGAEAQVVDVVEVARAEEAVLASASGRGVVEEEVSSCSTEVA